MRDFLTRALVALIAVPVLLWVFHENGAWLQGFVALLAVLGCIEIARAARSSGIPVNAIQLILTTLAFPVMVWSRGPDAWMAWLAIVVVLAGLSVIRRPDPMRALLAALVHIVTPIWLGIGFGALIAIRSLAAETAPGWLALLVVDIWGSDAGFFWLVFLFANLWIGDTAAYLAGSAIGGPKLSPAISPKKTIAGSVAQITASVLVGAAFVFGEWISAPPVLLLTAAVTIGIVGQLGDLFESVFKRAAGIKDFSTIIPGHGGVLDRFDSTLFAAPALWIIIRFWPN